MSEPRTPTVYHDAFNLPPPATFYRLTRHAGADDLTTIERQIAAELGITDFDDFGAGLCFNRYGDARLMAQAMAARLDRTFCVVRSDDEPIHMRYIAFGPTDRARIDMLTTPDDEVRP
jgi:hypothetical protein